MSLSRVILSSRIFLTNRAAISSSNLLRLQAPPSCVRGLSLTASVSGPGADHKYQSQEEKDEKARAGKKKKRVLVVGLMAGAVVGGVYGYYNYKKKLAQSIKSIGNDSQTKEFLLESAPPDFPPIR